jgi:hypothetical protein
MTDHQHAALTERQPITATSLADAREAARQLAGPSAQIVHNFLRQQTDCRELAQRLALELRYVMDVLIERMDDREAPEDYCWFHDGTEALAEFNAAMAGDAP